METLKKYVTGRNLQIGTLISAVFAILMFLTSASIVNNAQSVSSFADIGGLISGLKNFCNIFYLDFIVLLAVIAGYAFRMISEKDYGLSTKLLTGLNGCAFLLGLICFSAIHSIKAGLSGDLASFLQLGDLEGQLSILRIMLILQIGAGITAGYFLFYKKNSKKDNEASVGKEEQPDHESILDQIKAYYATEKGKRNIRIGGAAAGIFIVLIVTVNIYESTRRTEIDLTSACKVTFEGVSGSGTATINCSPDYDHSNEKISIFMNGVSYSIDKNGSLENGNKITLQASFSEATAESSKIKPVNTKRTYTVKGLEKAYLGFADVPEKLSGKFEAASKAYLEKDIQKQVNSLMGYDSITIEDISLIGIYYGYTSYDNNGIAYYVYRTKETRERSYSTKKEVNYYAVMIDNINPSYDLDLTDESDDMHINTISIYDEEKTDAKALKQFTKYYTNLEKVKTQPSSDIYKDERINKDS